MKVEGTELTIYLFQLARMFADLSQDILLWIYVGSCLMVIFYALIELFKYFRERKSGRLRWRGSSVQQLNLAAAILRSGPLGNSCHS